jgi:hypothetical protein
MGLNGQLIFKNPTHLLSVQTHSFDEKLFLQNIQTHNLIKKEKKREIN